MAQYAEPMQQSEEIQDRARNNDENLQEQIDRRTRLVQQQQQTISRMQTTTHRIPAAPSAASNCYRDAAIRNPQSSRVRSNESFPPWDEKAAHAQDAKGKLQVFHIQMTSYFKR